MTREERINDCIVGCKEGNYESQKIIYEILYPKMLGVCLKTIKNTEESEEIVNDAFIRIFQKINTYEGRGPFEAWVFVVLRRMILDRLRISKKKEERIPLLHIEFETIDFGFEENYYDCEELDSVLNSLSDKQKSVLEMYLDGFSHKEIGDKVGFSENTSKWHLFSIRKMLKERFNRI